MIHIRRKPETHKRLRVRVAEKTGRKHVRVTTLPKPTDAGNPDFRLWNGADRIIGYVEAKKPTEEKHNDGDTKREVRQTGGEGDPIQSAVALHPAADLAAGGVA